MNSPLNPKLLLCSALLFQIASAPPSALAQDVTPPTWAQATGPGNFTKDSSTLLNQVADYGFQEMEAKFKKLAAKDFGAWHCNLVRENVRTFLKDPLEVGGQSRTRDESENDIQVENTLNQKALYITAPPNQYLKAGANAAAIARSMIAIPTHFGDMMKCAAQGFADDQTEIGSIQWHAHAQLLDMQLDVAVAPVLKNLQHDQAIWQWISGGAGVGTAGAGFAFAKMAWFDKLAPSIDKASEPLLKEGQKLAEEMEEWIESFTAKGLTVVKAPDSLTQFVAANMRNLFTAINGKVGRYTVSGVIVTASGVAVAYYIPKDAGAIADSITSARAGFMDTIMSDATTPPTAAASPAPATPAAAAKKP